MTRDDDLEARYVAEVERHARLIAFAGKPAGLKWHLRGGMLEKVKKWFSQGIHPTVISLAQFRAEEAAGVGREIAAVFLWHDTLDRIVQATWAEWHHIKLVPEKLTPLEE